MTQPELAVVIATHFLRRSRLRRTLRSLAGQKFDHSFEVIVADDGGDSSIYRELEENFNSISAKAVGVPIPGEQRGAAFARNAALKVVSPSVYRVLFIDDDCIAPNNLLEAHMKYPKDIGVIGFRRHVNEKDVEKLKNFDKIEKVVWKDEVRLKAGRVAWLRRWEKSKQERFALEAFTCHVSYPIEVLKATGGFWDKMLGSGLEDLEMAVRAQRAGVKFVMMLSPTVYHQDHPISVQSVLNRDAHKKLLVETLKNKEVIHRPGAWKQPC